MAQLVSISKTLQLKKDATINEFSTWSIRYRALATNQKFADIMLGRETKPVPVDPVANCCLKTGWEKLNANYKLKTSRSKNELICTFYGTKLDSMEYPADMWMHGMQRIQRDLQDLHSFTIEDKDLISHVLTNIQHEYDTEMACFRADLKTGAPIDLDKMTEVLQEQFEM